MFVLGNGNADRLSGSTGGPSASGSLPGRRRQTPRNRPTSHLNGINMRTFGEPTANNFLLTVVQLNPDPVTP